MGMTIILLLVMLACLYLLYVRGYVAVQMKSALLYAGSFRGDRARFSGCTGYVKRRFPVKESRTYRFELDVALSDGEVWAELLDGDTNTLLRLDSQNSSAEASLECGGKYLLVIRYRRATGRHRLTYQ